MGIKLPENIMSNFGGGNNSNLTKSIGGSFVVKILSLAFSIVISIVLARLMSVNDFGRYSHMYSIFLVLNSIVQLGFVQLVVRETAAHHVKLEYGYIKGLSWVVGLFVGVLFALVVGVMLFAYKAGALDVIFKYETSYSTVVTICFLILFTTFGNLRAGMLRGLGRVVYGQLPENVIRPSVFLLSIIIIILFFSPLIKNLDVDRVFQLQLISVFTAFCCGIVMLWIVAPADLTNAVGEFRVSHWLSASIPLAGVSVFQIVSQNSGVIILGILSTTEQVALFKIALVCSSLTYFFGQAVNMVVAPLFARAKNDELSASFTHACYCIVVLTLPIVVFFLFFGASFLKFAFGELYSAAAPSLVVLSVGVFMSLCFGPISVLLSMTNRVWFLLRVSIFMFFVNISLGVLLSSAYGAIGIAMSASFSIVCQSFCLWYNHARKLKLENIYTRIWRICICAKSK